jgi:putative nucleotide binding protein
MEPDASKQVDNRSREEFAIVLDFLPNGRTFDSRAGRSQPVAQVVGKERFLLLELTPRQGVFLQPYEEVYIGDGKRDKVHHILGRVDVDKLSTTARSELDFVLHDIVKNNPQKFVQFFNKAGPLTIRTHSLELLPGFGKKHMWEVLERRQDKDFADFNDLRERVKMIPDPEKAIVRRILEEMGGKEKHYLFVERPPVHDERQR